MFNLLVEELKALLPDFGKTLAMDSKAVNSLANSYASTKEQDERRDLDANFGKKVYKGQKKDGTLWEKAVTWFGYKLHLIVDAKYELPVGYSTNQSIF